jgi:hypothetical protein
VGGGNSAGQAAVYLSSQVAKVWLIVRGPGLEASMSRYLVDRITARPNVEILTETTVTALEGQDGILEAIRCHSQRSSEEVKPAILARAAIPFAVLGQRSASSIRCRARMSEDRPLFAFAFHGGLGQALRGFAEADVAAGNADFVWVHLDLRDAGAQAWLRGRPWPPDVVETVAAPIQRGRLFIVPDLVYGHSGTSATNPMPSPCKRARSALSPPGRCSSPVGASRCSQSRSCDGGWKGGPSCRRARSG